MIPGIQLITAKSDCFNHIAAFCDLALEPQLFLWMKKKRLLFKKKKVGREEQGPISLKEIIYFKFSKFIFQCDHT